MQYEDVCLERCAQTHFYTSVVFGPGLQLQYLPHVCQRGHPALCQETAAREPPAHCRFYSRNLNRWKSKEWKKMVDELVKI